MFSQLFPKTNYVTYPNGMSNSPVTQEILDVLRRVRFIDNYGDTRAYKSYYVQTGETPDIVASKVYGHSEWYWLLMLFNDMTDPFRDWPRDGPDTDIQNVSYDVDVISYSPKEGDAAIEAALLYPYSVGDTIVRTNEDGVQDNDNPYTSNINATRDSVLGIDVSIADGDGTRLAVDDWFGILGDGGDIDSRKVSQVKLVRNPVTTISGFETQDGRMLSPFTHRTNIDTVDEIIIDPTTDDDGCF